MSNSIRRRTFGWTLIGATILIVLAAGILTGCQTAGKLVSSEESVVCPLCKNETRTTSIKGINFKTHVCPKCKKVYKLKDDWPDYGDYSDKLVGHVCDHCTALVEKCPLCHKQQ